MKIIATQCTAKELQTGDLFSDMPQPYWNAVEKNRKVIGEKVYIRTKNPCPDEHKEKEVYKIEIVEA